MLKNVFGNQPTGTIIMVVDSYCEFKETTVRCIVMQDQCKYNQCVFLLIFIIASTMQSGNEAKHIICSLFNDISHFQCFVTTHKLNFEPTSQTV